MIRDALKEYAGKEFDSRLQKRVEMEVTADLVGDFLFTNENFIHPLSSTSRNVLQKTCD